MRYTLCILAPPGSDSASRAQAFAASLLRQGHTLERVFFQDAGVLHAQAPGTWPALAAAHPMDLVLCSVALERHLPQAAPAAPFSIGGLVLLAEAAVQADRLLTFGP